MQIYWDIFSINMLNCQINIVSSKCQTELWYRFSVEQYFLIHIYVKFNGRLVLHHYLSQLLVVSVENHHQVTIIVYDEST
jgi:hypothetical protein